MLVSLEATGSIREFRDHFSQIYCALRLKYHSYTTGCFLLRWNDLARLRICTHMGLLHRREALGQVFMCLFALLHMFRDTIGRLPCSEFHERNRSKVQSIIAGRHSFSRSLSRFTNASLFSSSSRFVSPTWLNFTQRRLLLMNKVCLL